MGPSSTSRKEQESVARGQKHQLRRVEASSKRRKSVTTCGPKTARKKTFQSTNRERLYRGSIRQGGLERTRRVFVEIDLNGKKRAGEAGYENEEKQNPTDVSLWRELSEIGSRRKKNVFVSDQGGSRRDETSSCKGGAMGGEIAKKGKESL